MTRNFQDRPVVPREALCPVVEAAADAAGIAPGTVSFAYVDDRLMREHHRRFMGDPTTTDVLSFPAEPPGSARSAADEEAGYWGDVILCTDQAARQARERGHPYAYELGLLALHGVLHLLGHDHTRDGGGMRRLEERLRPRTVVERLT